MDQEISSDKENQSPKDNGNSSNRSSVLEKIFTVLSLIAILLMAGYLGKESFATRAPAAFELETAPPRLSSGVTFIEVSLRNTGDKAAKAVNVRGQIETETDKPLEAEATLDWLPGKSTRKVTLIFPDSTTTRPQIRVVGYEEP